MSGPEICSEDWPEMLCLESSVKEARLVSGVGGLKGVTVRTLPPGRLKETKLLSSGGGGDAGFPEEPTDPSDPRIEPPGFDAEPDIERWPEVKSDNELIPSVEPKSLFPTKVSVIVVTAVMVCGPSITVTFPAISSVVACSMYVWKMYG